MRISPARLPRLLGVVVIAFAQYEARPLLGAVELFRGIAIQLAYRWATGRVVADPSDRSVLLWSVVSRAERDRNVSLELCGILAATAVGCVLVVISSAILLLPLCALLVAVGADGEVVAGVGFAVVGLRWLMTCWRAFHSYQNEQKLMAQLPETSAPRWRIDYLAAIPARSGLGGRVLDLFLGYADESGAEVVLHCERHNVGFYRRHGFHLTPTARSGNQRAMLRKPVGARPPGRVAEVNALARSETRRSDETSEADRPPIHRIPLPP